MAVARIIDPPALAPAGPFSHALVIPAGHDIVVTAGEIGTIDRAGTIPDSYSDQVPAAIDNLKNVLAAAGAIPRDIIKLTYYIVDYDVTRRSVHINALQAFLGDHKPATALIGVAKLANPKIKFEIEAIAAIKPSGTRTGQTVSSKLA